jgi:Tfp pilus assembly protein PilF
VQRIHADALDERAHYELACEYLREGALLQAAAEFRRCVELNPEFVAAWQGLADAYRAAGVEKEARIAEDKVRALGAPQALL